MKILILRGIQRWLQNQWLKMVSRRRWNVCTIVEFPWLVLIVRCGRRLSGVRGVFEDGGSNSTAEA